MRVAVAFLALAALLLLVGTVLHQTQDTALAQDPQQTTLTLLSASYDLSWWTVDGGGGNSSGGNYILDGTAGQPDPGPLLSRDDYNLEGGFWGGGLSGVSWYYIYLPLVMRNW